MGVLREVVEADLPVFYAHQRDQEAAAMAAFPPRERDAFMAHWAKTLANDSALTWTVVSDGAVAGNIGCWEDDGRRLVGYWIGREFWGRGLATQALAELLDVVDARPLHAYVARSNVASIRVLEKCGFVRVGEHRGDDGPEELDGSIVHPGDRCTARRNGSILSVDAAGAFMLTLHERPAEPILTPREREVLGLVARGLTNHEIAGSLWVAPSTVAKHHEQAYQKLGVHSRTAAIARLAEVTDSPPHARTS